MKNILLDYCPIGHEVVSYYDLQLRLFQNLVVMTNCNIIELLN